MCCVAHLCAQVEPLRHAPHHGLSGVPQAEDLIFFYAHLNRGGTLYCVDEPLLMYRRAHGAHASLATSRAPASRLS